MHRLDLREDEHHTDLGISSDWDIAIRYHDLKSRHSLIKRRPLLRQISARAILRRAREVVGSVVHPVKRCTSPLVEVPFDAERLELNLEETLENQKEIWVDYDVRRDQFLNLCVDTSLSMTGEKLALTAVSLCVVLLQFPNNPIGVVAFENEAKVLKRPDESISVFQLVERFLDVPAQGYTHLEEGLRKSLQLQNQFSDHLKIGPSSTILLSDGKYTAGKDPAYLAKRFDHLIVLKMGQDRASHALCAEMARLGRGRLLEVGDLQNLPGVMNGVLKDVLRGRSVA